MRWTVIAKELQVLAKKKSVKVYDVEVSRQKQATMVISNNLIVVIVFLFFFQKAILAYNQKYKALWSFDALSTFVRVSILVHIHFNILMQLKKISTFFSFSVFQKQKTTLTHFFQRLLI